MPSQVDQTISDLVAAGYTTGSIQDRQRKYLDDVIPGNDDKKSVGDMQRQISANPIRDILTNIGGGGGGQFFPNTTSAAYPNTTRFPTA